MKRKRILSLFLVFLLVFIWGNSLLSRQVSGTISDTIMEYMNAAAKWLGLGEDFFTYRTDTDGDGVEENTSHLVRKMAHVAEFAALAVVLWLLREGSDKKRSGFTLGLAVLVGAIDETLQIFSHRGSQLRDVAIDAVGALLGIVVMLLVAYQRRKNGKSI